MALRIWSFTSFTFLWIPGLGSLGCPKPRVPCNLSGVDVVVQEDCVLGEAKVASRSITVRPGARLVLDRWAEVHLVTGAVRLDGELWIGCDDDAFQGHFLLELTGAYGPSKLSFSYGRAGLPDLANGNMDLAKGLLVTNTGRLEIHGAPKVAWLYLRQDVSRGSSTLLLDGGTNWEAGDQVVIGSTSPDASHSEVATVASVQVGASGTQVKLVEPLRHGHSGRFRGRGKRLNAPVGLLTRNVKMKGRMASAEAWHECRHSLSHQADTAEAAACFGGHMMFIQGATVHIEHAELSLLGQALHVARYPVHWHLAGNVEGQFLRNVSMHHNFQRCVTIHGAEGAQVQDNVCYNTFGHAFYLEDGIETGNTFQGNLMVSAHPGGSVCTDWESASGPRSNLQLGPAGFWITNPNNSFVGNHVVGAGTGFWFTFPVTAPSAISAMGLSRVYFNDTRSGHGPGSWWLHQEPARTPVRAFLLNTVTSAQRGIHVDGRVEDSVDRRVPCWGDDCATCSGPLEGSFAWVPMRFDAGLPAGRREYRFQANRFDDFCAAHILSPIRTEARAVWSSGGYIHFRRAIFFNAHIVAASMPELTSACFKVTKGTPPGFTLTFDRSLFVSGPVSNTFFQLYDGGIHVLNSRWIITAAGDDFHVTKPKCAFGGNGNPLYVQGSQELAWPLKVAEADLFNWARSFAADSTKSRIANFDCIAWGSPYVNGSHVYSPDGFGTARPTILAPHVHGVLQLKGRSQCEDFLRRTPPRFACGKGFGTYGLWCGTGIPLESCPGAMRPWFSTLAPWSTESAVKPGEESEVEEAEEAESPLELELGDCAFPVAPPRSTPFFWDLECRLGGLGCNADGQHMECRWCGFAPYHPCPPSPSREVKGSASAQAAIAVTVSAFLLALILCACWCCARFTGSRPSRISAQNSELPVSSDPEGPHLLGRSYRPQSPKAKPQSSGIP